MQTFPTQRPFARVLQPITEVNTAMLPINLLAPLAIACLAVHEGPGTNRGSDERGVLCCGTRQIRWPSQPVLGNRMKPLEIPAFSESALKRVEQ